MADEVRPATDPRGASLETSALLDRLPGVAAYDLTVVDTDRVTPSMQRIRLAADGLSDLAYEPGQDLMIAVPEGGTGHFRRRYTIRSLDRATGTVELQIVVHGDGDGPGARWAAGVAPGDTAEAIGPRGKVTLDPEADWHLFVGDESALPVTFAMVEALGRHQRAVVVLEVAGPDDVQPLAVPPGVDVDLRWLHRDGRPVGTGAALLEAVDALRIPDGRGHAYVAGELRTVSALRRRLEGRNLAGERISAKPYWRLGVANAAHGEPPRPD